MVDISKPIGFPQLTFTSLENAGAIVNTSLPVQIISSATANVKGAWVQLLTSTSNRTSMLIFFYRINTTGADYLIDIGTGTSGSEVVLISDVYMRGIANFSSITVPMQIPSGTRIAARCQASTGSSNANVLVMLLENPQYSSIYNQSMFPISGLVSIEEAGTQPLTSDAVTITGGTTNVKGAWSQLLSTSTKRATWIIVEAFNLAGSGQLIDIGTGAVGSEIVLIPNFPVGTATSSYVTGMFPILIPAGTRIVARTQGPSGCTSKVCVHLVEEA